MQYGYFDDAAREYVITEPQTPSPWINYLGSEAFFTLMSNTSGGYSFYKDARMLRLTRYRYNNVPTDAGGQYFYINDGGVVWTPGFMPVKTPLDRYECRHGLGYTRITGEKNGLEAVETAMVPRGVNALVTKVELTNRSDIPFRGTVEGRSISLPAGKTIRTRLPARCTIKMKNCYTGNGQALEIAYPFQ